MVVCYADVMSKTAALEFLKKHHMGVLSTVSKDGHPWGSAIVYASDEDLKFYFVTRANTLKYQNIEQNPTVALTIADPEDQVTVQVQGTASRVPAKDYTDVVFKKLASVKPQGDANWAPPVMKVHKGDYMVLCITPSHVQYADFKQKKNDAFDEYIEQIL